MYYKKYRDIGRYNITYNSMWFKKPCTLYYYFIRLLEWKIHRIRIILKLPTITGPEPIQI